MICNFSTTKSLKLFVIFLIIYFHDCYQAETTGNSKREKWLDHNYWFKWETTDIQKSIKLRVEVKTKGWFGFGFSKHGMTTEADIVIGWVDERGQSSSYVSRLKTDLINYQFFNNTRLLGRQIWPPFSR